MPLRVLSDGADINTAHFDLRDVAVNDLDHADVAAVGHEVPGLCFDAGRVNRDPLHVALLQLCVGRRLCLFANGLDSRRAIDGLLGAGDVGQPRIRSVEGNGVFVSSCLTVASPSSSSWR